MINTPVESEIPKETKNNEKTITGQKCLDHIEEDFTFGKESNTKFNTVMSEVLELFIKHKFVCVYMCGYFKNDVSKQEMPIYFPFTFKNYYIIHSSFKNETIGENCTFVGVLRGLRKIENLDKPSEEVKQ